MDVCLPLSRRQVLLLINIRTLCIVKLSIYLITIDLNTMIDFNRDR